jgi:hypothetical protein
MPKSELPSIDMAIESVLSKLDEPIDIHDFYNKVLEIRPSASKKPTISIYNNIKRHFVGESIAFLDKQTIVPLRIAMPGVRFRIPLSDIEIKRKVLIIDPFFRGFVSRRNESKNFDLVDEKGNPLPKKIVSIKQTADGFLGKHDYNLDAFDLTSWGQMKLVKPGDSFLVTIESWEPKRFRLRLESKNERRSHNDEIASKNKELADLLFNMLEESVNESIYIKESVIIAYLRLSDPKGYPGDHWIDVLDKDPRMNLDSFSINYPENRSLLESFVDRTPPVTKQKFTAQQADQVYIFRAMFKFRTSIWRIIEIQGSQTLAQFDKILRKAFNHDSSDHLGGFWKMVRRGQTNRSRDIELGDVEPFGGGTGAKLKIAEIGLNVGDKLKYVYDFGDWVEHEILLEAIEPPKAKTKYPSIIEQNKPKSYYCEDCKADGKKTIAVYFCVTCSDEEQRRIFVCEECSNTLHEDHYIDEITY